MSSIDERSLQELIVEYTALIQQKQHIELLVAKKFTEIILRHQQDWK